jgi:hypothetical protein
VGVVSAATKRKPTKAQREAVDAVKALLNKLGCSCEDPEVLVDDTAVHVYHDDACAVVGAEWQRGAGA